MNGLLRSFKRNPAMEQDYFDFMAKLLERSHAVPVPSSLRSQTLEDTVPNRRKFGTFLISGCTIHTNQTRFEWYSIHQQNSKVHR